MLVIYPKKHLSMRSCIPNTQWEDCLFAYMFFICIYFHGKFAWGCFTPISGVMGPYLQLLFWAHFVVKIGVSWAKTPALPFCKIRYFLGVDLPPKNLIGNLKMNGGSYTVNPYGIGLISPITWKQYPLAKRTLNKSLNIFLLLNMESPKV